MRRFRYLVFRVTRITVIISVVTIYIMRKGSTTNLTSLITTTLPPAFKYKPDEQDTKILFSPALNPVRSFPTIKTNLKTWDFRSTVICPLLNISDIGKKRQHLKINCRKEDPLITYEVTSSINVTSFPFGNSCVSDIIDKYCNDGKPVPNVLHYIWYGTGEVKFHHFLSFMSVLRFMNPCLMIFHGEHLPHGKYWDYFTSKYFKIIHLTRPLMTHIYGHELSYKQHGADVMRIEALQRYGGIYIDTDTIILREIDELRKYSVTMGNEMRRKLGNQFIMATRGAEFLNLWHKEYKDYQVKNWTYNSQVVPKIIALKYPELIHVEGNKFCRPNWYNRNMIFQSNFNWTVNYAMHLYARNYKNKTDEFIVRQLNTTYGAVSRHVLFGNKELCSW